MPELPEVETVMRGLAARMQGQVISHAALHRADLRWPFPTGLTQAMTGARVIGFRRRAKYMLMRLDTGRSVMIHLGMSGRMLIMPPSEDREPAARPQHEHMSLLLQNGWRFGFIDPRRFGSVDLMETAEEDQHRLLAALGPEPLDDSFDAAHLSARLAGRATPIKAALLDQTNVAGLGNIYVCEAMFRAKISPLRLAGDVAGRRAQRLVPHIKATLLEAIAAGGSSLRDYVQTDGALGYFQHGFKVYGREGTLCERCPGPPACPGIARIVQSGRSSFYCPRTQR